MASAAPQLHTCNFLDHLGFSVTKNQVLAKHASSITFCKYPGLLNNTDCFTPGLEAFNEGALGLGLTIFACQTKPTNCQTSPWSVFAIAPDPLNFDTVLCKAVHQMPQAWLSATRGCAAVSHLRGLAAANYTTRASSSGWPDPGSLRPERPDTSDDLDTFNQVCFRHTVDAAEALGSLSTSPIKGLQAQELDDLFGGCPQSRGAHCTCITSTHLSSLQGRLIMVRHLVGLTFAEAAISYCRYLDACRPHYQSDL